MNATMTTASAATFEKANAMPAPTWHRLNMNDVCIDIPAGLRLRPGAGLEPRGDASAFDEALACAQEAWEREHPAPEPDKMDTGAEESEDAYGGIAQSAYQAGADAIEAARSLSAAFATGLGDDAFTWMRSVAGAPVVITSKPGGTIRESLFATAADGCASVAAVDIVAAPNSTVEVALTIDSPEVGNGMVGTSVRVFAGAGARVVLSRTQTLDESWIDLDDVGLFADASAHIEVHQTTLGGSQAFGGLAGDLRGQNARADVETHYLGHGRQSLDFTYVLRHRGQKTTCNINANGVLADTSKKTLRGTIDFVRGCKGSTGQETETVLLTDEDVENRTIPVILCNEEDVAGNHGATIGHVRDEQLFYLESRGLSPEACERMFASAMLEHAVIEAPDDFARKSVIRLGGTLIDDFAELVEGE